MAEKKPTYDELQSEYRMFRDSLSTFLCVIAFLFYSFFLASIFILAQDGLTLQFPGDNLPIVIYLVGYVFLWLYGIWQFVAGIIHIWWGDADTMIASFARHIEWFFQAQARAFAKEQKPKKVQTELPVMEK
jgi:hypothetical protein